MNKITEKITKITENQPTKVEQLAEEFLENSPIFSGDYDNQKLIIKQKIEAIISEENQLKKANQIRIHQGITRVFIVLLGLLASTYFMTVKFTSPIIINNNNKANEVFANYITSKIDYDQEVNLISQKNDFQKIAQKQIDGITKLFNDGDASLINQNKQELESIKNQDLDNYFKARIKLLEAYEKISGQVSENSAIKKAIASGFNLEIDSTKISDQQISQKVANSKQQFEKRTNDFNSTVSNKFVEDNLKLSEAFAPLVPFFENTTEIDKKVEDKLKDYANYHGTTVDRYFDGKKINLKNIVLDYQNKVDFAMQEALKNFQIVHYDDLIGIQKNDQFKAEAKNKVDQYFQTK